MRHLRKRLVRAAAAVVVVVLALAGMAAIAAIAAATPASAAPVTYTVNRTVGIGSIVGKIQTDGTFGVLTLGNITFWELFVDGDGNGGGDGRNSRNGYGDFI